MTTGSLLFIGGLVFLNASALLAFCWAVKDGQLNNLSEAPQTIFDKDEPVGIATDQFPATVRK